MAEVEDFPSIGQAIGVAIRRSRGDRIERLDQTGMIEGRAALGGHGGEGRADGGVIVEGAAGRIAATGVDFGGDRGEHCQKRKKDERRGGRRT